MQEIVRGVWEKMGCKFPDVAAVVIGSFYFFDASESRK